MVGDVDQKLLKISQLKVASITAFGMFKRHHKRLTLAYRLYTGVSPKFFRRH